MTTKDFVNTIQNMDCLEGMKRLDDQSVDLVVTSPPYNVGKEYGVVSDDLPIEEYFTFIDGVIKELFRVVKKGGRMCINIPVLGNSFAKSKGEEYLFYLDRYVSLLKKNSFKLREVITWVKSYRETDDAFCGGNTAWGSWLSPSSPYCRAFTEFIIVVHKETPLKEGEETDLTPSEFLKYTRNVWFFPSEVDRTHPAPFPEELPKRCIKLYSFVGDTILDPFAGSGTTLFVAKQLKREYIGFEINPTFYKFAKERVSQHFLSGGKSRNINIETEQKTLNSSILMRQDYGVG